jgi:hypothetical protein
MCFVVGDIIKPMRIKCLTDMLVRLLKVATFRIWQCVTPLILCHIEVSNVIVDNL